MKQQSLPLEPIRLGDEISWWPFAPGWYVLITISVIFLTFIMWKLFQNYRHNKPKKAAIKLLNNAQIAYAAHGDTATYIQETSAILKRFLLTQFPRARVSNLFGQHFTDFIVDCCDDKILKELLMKHFVGLYSDSKYKKEQPDKIDLNYLLIKWVKKFPTQKVVQQKMEIPHARV